MDDQGIERIFDAINEVIDGEEYDTIMVALGALHNSLAILKSKDEKHLRTLYTMLGDAAVCMAMLDEDEKEIDTPRYEPGSFSIN